MKRLLLRFIFITLFVLLVIALTIVVRQKLSSKDINDSTTRYIHPVTSNALEANKNFLDKVQVPLTEKLNNLSFKNEKPTIKIKFTNFWPDFELKDLPLLYEVLTEKYNIEVNEKDYDVILDGVHTNVPINTEKAIKIFFTTEVIRPQVQDGQSFEYIKLKPDDYDLSIGFDFLEHPKYLRIPLYYFFYTNNINTNYNRGTCNPKKKYFACFLVSSGEYYEGFNDGCIARNRMFHKLSLYKRVESGGKYLNNIGKVVPYTETLEWLSNCKFVIAYENQTYPGYITEKPFQAYYAGSVPIYYGHSDGLLESEVEKKALIYAGDFASEDEMVDYIKKVDQDDELYCKIWNQKIITNPDRNYESIKNKLRNKLDEIFKEKLGK